jgi:hypothetical protein
MAEDDEKQKLRDESAKKEAARFLFVPPNIDSTTPDILEAHADLGSKEVARAIHFHRALGNRMNMLKRSPELKTEEEPGAETKEEKVVKNQADTVADRYSLESIGSKRLGRTEALIIGQAKGEEKPGIRLEDTRNIMVPAHEGAEKKKGRFGV